MIVSPREIITGIEGITDLHGWASAIELSKAGKECGILCLSLGFITWPSLSQALIKLGAVHAIQMKEVIIFMTLNINGESVEPVHQGLVSELLLPLSPLIIKDIVQRWDSIPLLPLIKEVDIGGRRIQTVQLCLGAEDILGIKGGLDPELSDVVWIV
jgi:hypothetical protein